MIILWFDKSLKLHLSISGMIYKKASYELMEVLKCIYKISLFVGNMSQIENLMVQYGPK